MIGSNTVDVLFPKAQLRQRVEPTVQTLIVQYTEEQLIAFKYGLYRNFSVLGLYSGRAAMAWTAGVVEADIIEQMKAVTFEGERYEYY